MEVSLPRLGEDKKRELAMGLTDAYAGVTGLDRGRIGIRFQESGAGETAYAGELDTGGGAVRPYVHVVLYCPVQPRERKQDIVRQITAALHAVLDHPGCRPVIHIQEHLLDNVGVNGDLLSDR